MLLLPRQLMRGRIEEGYDDELKRKTDENQDRSRHNIGPEKP